MPRSHTLWVFNPLLSFNFFDFIASNNNILIYHYPISKDIPETQNQLAHF